MLVFSDPAFWEDDEGVWQMLVFASETAESEFLRRYNLPNAPRTNSGYPKDTGIGAMYKLRAIRNPTGRWNYLIRCGETGALLDDVQVRVEDKETAMFLAVSTLHAKLSSQLGEKSRSMQVLSLLSRNTNT